jgi:hypothetical protein
VIRTTAWSLLVAVALIGGLAAAATSAGMPTPPLAGWVSSDPLPDAAHDDAGPRPPADPPDEDRRMPGPADASEPTTGSGAPGRDGRSPSSGSPAAPVGQRSAEVASTVGRDEVARVPADWLGDPELYGVVPTGVAPTGTAPELEPATVTDEGFEVAPSASGPVGEGTPVRYTVELEPEVDVGLRSLVGDVEEALTDPRSWVQETALERVQHPTDADIRVVLATPTTVDQLCARAGLDTVGRFSCWNGEFAALNADRWQEGADDFPDLATYRRYLVNHEFGHGLGYGHVSCPGDGEPAPIMMQQTMGTDGCEANGWPHPDVAATPEAEDA